MAKRACRGHAQSRLHLTNAIGNPHTSSYSRTPPVPPPSEPTVMLRFLASRAQSLQPASSSSQGVNSNSHPSTAPSSALSQAASEGSSGSPPPEENGDEVASSEAPSPSSNKSHASGAHGRHATPPSNSSPHSPTSKTSQSEEQDEPARDDECPLELQWRFVYVPPAAWQWAASASLSHVQFLQRLYGKSDAELSWNVWA